MIIILLLVCWAVAGVAFVIGGATADRTINKNHHQLALFNIQLLARDNIMPFLSGAERRELDGLIDDYSKIDWNDEVVGT